MRRSKKLHKNTKNPYFWVQDHLRSTMLALIKSLSLVLVMISSVSVPICNHFHTIRVNSGKTLLRGYTSFTLACAGLYEPRG